MVMLWKAWPQSCKADSAALTIRGSTTAAADALPHTYRSGLAMSKILYWAADRDFSFASALLASPPLTSLSLRAMDGSSLGTCKSNELFLKVGTKFSLSCLDSAGF